MLNEKNMHRSYMAEVVAVAVYLMNMTPTAAIHSKTPLENETAPSDAIQGEVTSTQAVPRKSERVKRPIQRFMHFGFLATRFAFMS
ncbi:hypothetical protein R1sor_014974 [Riccia sorocarpa]|uniref:Uncharacterized protein n=1 Tax=Riccia sorocarpa TaxID=122646 RepID=A0ABD3HAX3_9MARC